MKRFFIMAMIGLTMVACTSENKAINPNSKNGVMCGEFSVSRDSKVHFSQGNLQFQACSGIWCFAENQYEYIGEYNANISSKYNGWIDLFGWGTGNNPTLSSESVNDYQLFTDWGNNKIVNGGNRAGIWRTLDSEEWYYLIWDRNNAEKLRGPATVNEVQGYVFLPDEWEIPSGVLWKYNSNNWSINTYSVSDWDKMEKAGAIFLPAAGWREGVEVDITDGYYHSSQKYNENEKWTMFFGVMVI